MDCKRDSLALLHKIKSYQLFCTLTCFTVLTLLLLTFNSQLLLSQKLNFFIKKFSAKSDQNASVDKLFEYYAIHERMCKEENSSLQRISFNGPNPSGYGNKLYSFITSMLIAISPPITLFASINDSVGLKPAEFKLKSYHFSARQPWSLNKNVNLLMSTQVPGDYMRYFYKAGNPLFMEICTNKTYFPKLLYYDLVTSTTINTALSAINTQNATEAYKQESLFRVGFEVGGNILNRIWTPNEAIQAETSAYLAKKFVGHFVIGIQLRFQFLNQSADTLKFLNCATQIENDYLRMHTPLNGSSGFFKWFIASDTEWQLNSILEKYPHKAFSSNGTISHIVYNAKGYSRTILDVELLSRCDEIIITGGSTFGWIAAMKSFKMPFYVNGKSTMQACARANLSYPPHTPYMAGTFK